MSVKCAAQFPSTVSPPQCLRDGEQWNVFWRQVLEVWDGQPLMHFSAHVSRFRKDFRLMADLGHSDVLFAGNGVSTLPYLARHEGFRAHAVDIASVATEFVADLLPPPVVFTWFYSEEAERWNAVIGRTERRYDRHLTEQAIERAFRPGGSITFETADLFDLDQSTVFHTIVAQLVIELYDRERQWELARRFYQWLEPGGILIVESFRGLSLVSSEWEPVEGVEPIFEAVGFFIHQKAAYQWRQEQHRRTPHNLIKAWKLNSPAYQQKIDAEFQERCEAIRTADIERLRTGDKMVIFRYGGEG